MTFQHSLYLSFAMHLMIFGSAIAVAHYGGGAVAFLPRVIQVSLVSSASESGRETGVAQGLQRRSSRVSPRTPALPVEHQDRAPEETSADQGTTSLIPVDGTGTREDIVNSNEGGHIISSAGTGNNSTRGFGLSAPDLWSSIESAIERAKNYPRLARERGIEGVVRLRFKLNPEGSIEKIEIVESSGSDILDTASIRAVYRAAPMPSVQGWIEVPIAYVLQ